MNWEFFPFSRKDADENSSAKSTPVDGASNSESSTKCIRTGKLYACSQCSYSADKKVSLNRHMRMHQTSPITSSATSNGGEECSSQVHHSHARRRFFTLVITHFIFFNF